LNWKPFFYIIETQHSCNKKEGEPVMAHIKELLHAAGLKYTVGREAMLTILMAAGGPLTQEELSQRLKGTEFNRVSIYRALDSFWKAGLVHRVESGERIWKFAFCGCGQQGHCHPHFICRSCGTVECLEGVAFPTIGLKCGYQVEEREYYLKGICARCS
jgi:Fur family transcriptional regulator, ferric uptake regulator